MCAPGGRRCFGSPRFHRRRAAHKLAERLGKTTTTTTSGEQCTNDGWTVEQALASNKFQANCFESSRSGRGQSTATWGDKQKWLGRKSESEPINGRHWEA